MRTTIVDEVMTMVDTNGLEFRPLTAADLGTVGLLRVKVLGWDAATDYVAAAVDGGHSVGAFHGGGLVGFRYQRAVVPDVLTDGLLLVHPLWRGSGVGRGLVSTFERTAPSQFVMSLVVNTDLLPSVTPKRDATGFWTACGYELLVSTGPSRVLSKRLAGG